MKTFVINLDKDTERMRFMHEQLTRIGIPYERESAIYGKHYFPTKEEYDADKAQAAGGHILLPGEVGCALSHARVIQKIVTEQLPYALILEDDVTLPTDFKAVLEREIAKNNNDWEYLLFDYVPVGLTFLKLWWNGAIYNYGNTQGVLKKLRFVFIHLLKACYILPLSLFERARELVRRYHPGPVRFFRPVYFAGAYLVTLSGAKKLHDLSQPVIYTADHLPNKARRLKGLRFRGYCPLIVRQEKEVFGSSILGMEASQMKHFS